MILSVASTAPALLPYNFPEKYRTTEFVKSVIEQYPDTGRYILKFIETSDA